MPSPEFEALLTAIRASPRPEPAAGAAGVRQARESMDLALGAIPLADGVMTGQTDAGGCPAVWVRPQGGAMDRVMLYLHGGGYRAGSAAAFSGFASQFAAVMGMPVLLPDYRLAPEHPFPAAVEDVVQAYKWLLAQGYSPGRVVLLGDTAGGGLVVSAMLAARGLGLPQPAAGACLSPLFDLTASGESYEKFAEDDPIYSRAQALAAAVDYLGGANPREPLASPLFADLSGLAPLMVHAADREVLVDDARTLVAGVLAAGGRANLEIWPDLMHFWHVFVPDIPESTAAVLGVAEFLMTYIGA
jgi:monoterpene epsilon-lactone hydrolase